MQKNKPAILQRMDDAVSSSTIDALTSMDSDTVYNVRQLLRDQKLARANPQQYCADRCIATGYCDVFEDLYVFSRCCIDSWILFSLKGSSHFSFSYYVTALTSLRKKWWNSVKIVSWLPTPRSLVTFQKPFSGRLKALRRERIWKAQYNNSTCTHFDFPLFLVASAIHTYSLQFS